MKSSSSSPGSGIRTPCESYLSTTCEQFQAQMQLIIEFPTTTTTTTIVITTIIITSIVITWLRSKLSEMINSCSPSRRLPASPPWVWYHQKWLDKRHNCAYLFKYLHSNRILSPPGIGDWKIWWFSKSFDKVPLAKFHLIWIAFFAYIAKETTI